MSSNLHSLYQAILACRDPQELQNFLRDLLTENEMSEMAERWTAARMLSEGASYVQVIEKTGMSSTTVARVAAWLNKGTGGYKKALARTSPKKKKTETKSC